MSQLDYRAEWETAMVSWGQSRARVNLGNPLPSRESPMSGEIMPNGLVLMLGYALRPILKLFEDKLSVYANFNA